MRCGLEQNEQAVDLLQERLAAIFILKILRC